MARPRIRISIKSRTGIHRGITFIESLIAIGISFVLIQVLVSSTIVMTNASKKLENLTNVASKLDLILGRVQRELSTGSTDTDPATGLQYASIAGEEGEESLTFRRVSGFASNAGELVPIWSTPITYSIDANGSLQRTQDGASAELVRNVLSLDFSIDSIGRIGMEIFAGGIGPNGENNFVFREIKVRAAM